MSLLTNNELKEQQKINELEKKIQDERDKLDKKVTHQKIVIGEFFLDMLEKNAVDGLKKYTAENLSDFLTRKSDKEDFESFIDKLKNSLEEEVNSNNTDDDISNDKADDINTDYNNVNA